MQEIWKNVPQSDGRYQVSNMGNIRSLQKGTMKMLKPYNSQGYRCVELVLQGIVKKHISMHRLVATVFKRNPKNKP